MSDLWIYFLGIPPGLVKIGKSRKARGVRLAQHQAPTLDGHRPNVVPLCEVRATADIDETAVHAYFADLRAGEGVESFRADVRLIEYIRWLRDEHYVSVPEDDDETRNAKPVVPSESWLPRPERRKARDMTLLPGMYPPFDLAPRRITVDDFYTNQRIIEAARETMGGIDLDPATHPMANTVVRATQFYTVSTNGLQHPWPGRVWVNPPFSQWEQWATKILTEVASGRASQLCALAAMRTVTARYFAPMLEGCDAMCITKGRIPFWGALAERGSINDGHAIFYFGDAPMRFAENFAAIGTVFPSLRLLHPSPAQSAPSHG